VQSLWEQSDSSSLVSHGGVHTLVIPFPDTLPGKKNVCSHALAHKCSDSTIVLNRPIWKHPNRQLVNRGRIKKGVWAGVHLSGRVLA
jgi:hypothetical protein